MEFIKKNCMVLMFVICLLLIVSTNITYSKFSYQKELSGSIDTLIPLPSLYETLVALPYTFDTNVNFKNNASSTNGQGLMMISSTANDTYPILYYRGDVADNNVMYGGFCWLIVRTTETGGVKLVFNGPIVNNTDGTKRCTNYSGVGGETADTNYNDVFVGSTVFNPIESSPVYAGYMYNDTNKFYSNYTLDGEGYTAHLSDNSVIENGLDSETGRHTQNKTDSTIKEVIDDWYEANILGKQEESLLEDAIWCNDRSVISTIHTIENYGTYNQFNFAATTRLVENTTRTPSLTCNRDIDKFTVDSANGNGDLDYPIGLLTMDEAVLAGIARQYNGDNFTMLLSLYSYESSYHLLSPRTFATRTTTFTLTTGCFSYSTGGEFGIRPAISLKNTAKVSDGNGSFESPYIINP